jgi:hypothetical protein
VTLDGVGLIFGIIGMLRFATTSKNQFMRILSPQFTLPCTASLRSPVSLPKRLQNANVSFPLGFRNFRMLQPQQFSANSFTTTISSRLNFRLNPSMKFKKAVFSRFNRYQSQSHVTADGQSVSQYVLMSCPFWFS